MNTNYPNSFRCVTTALALALTPVLSLAAADSMPPSLPATGNTLKHSDRSFLEKATKTGLEEVAISQSVQDHLANSQVRDLAQMMVSEHTSANNQLMTLASNKGVSLGSIDTAEVTEKWSKKDSDTDKDYVGKMIDDHEAAIKLYEKGAKSEDTDIAAFAEKSLPTLQRHLQMARDLKKSM